MNLNKKILFLVGIALAAFISLAVFVYYNPSWNFDIKISQELQEEINEQRSFEISSGLSWVSIFGNAIISPICVMLIALVFYLAHEVREACFVLCVFLADALDLFLKLLIHRPRPTEDIVKIVQKFTQTSFPSGHVVHYVVFFGFLLFIIFYKKKFWLPLRLLIGSVLVLLILTIPISRVYLGAHWTTDVIGGYLVGFIFLATMLGLYLRKSSASH